MATAARPEPAHGEPGRRPGVDEPRPPAGGPGTHLSAELEGILADVRRLALLEVEHVRQMVRDAAGRAALATAAALGALVVVCASLVLLVLGAVGAASEVLGLPGWGARLVVGASALALLAAAALLARRRAERRRHASLEARLRVLD